MRAFAVLPCAVGVLLGCSSTPLEGSASDGDAAIPAVSSGAAADGRFGPIAAYPDGPYGSARGAVIRDHTFLGWRDPVAAGFDSSRLHEVRLSDFYDPRGDRTELIVVNSSAVWCPVCRTEMAIIDSRELSSSYRASKVALLGTLFEDGVGAPARPEDLALWANGLQFVVDFPLVLDPGLALGPYFADSATPLNLVIDARTMEILQVYMGYGESLWSYVDGELIRRGLTPPER